MNLLEQFKAHKQEIEKGLEEKIMVLFGPNKPGHISIVFNDELTEVELIITNTSVKNPTEQQMFKNIFVYNDQNNIIFKGFGQTILTENKILVGTKTEIVHIDLQTLLTFKNVISEYFTTVVNKKETKEEIKEKTTEEVKDKEIEEAVEKVMEEVKEVIKEANETKQEE